MLTLSTMRRAAAGAFLLICTFPAFGSENKEIAKRFADAFASGDTATLTEIVAQDVTDHGSPPGTAPGRQGLLDAVALFRAWFPDLKIAVDQQVASGDLVAQYGTLSGTNTGSFMGKPATGKFVQMPWMDMYRIKDGRIVETWHVEDIAGMLGQLGLMKH